MSIRVIGHRGYPARYPENTVASLLAALLAGADGVEFDVRLSSDGAAILLHDPDTFRVTSGAVSLSASRSSLAELKQVDLGMGQHVPSLDEALQALPEGIDIFLEVKDVDAAEPSYWAVASAKRLDDVVFISFEQEALEAIRRLSRRARLGLNFEEPGCFRKLWRLHEELGLYLANPSIDVLRAIGFGEARRLLYRARELGMRVSVWTINTPRLVAGIDDLLDYVITDDPEAWRQRLAVHRFGDGVTRVDAASPAWAG